MVEFSARIYKISIWNAVHELSQAGSQTLWLCLFWLTPNFKPENIRFSPLNEHYRRTFTQQEHHLQRAICAGLIIPTPEVTDVPLKDFYDRVCPSNYKQPRQLIHMQRKPLFFSI